MNVNGICILILLFKIYEVEISFFFFYMEEYGKWSVQSLDRGSEVIPKSLELKGVKLVFGIWHIQIFDPITLSAGSLNNQPYRAAWTR